MVKLWAALGALALMACSPAEPSATATQAATAEEPVEARPERHPTSGLKLIDVTIESNRGPVTFRTEVANTPQAQARGLMYRTELGDDEAMIFPSETPQPRGFWMKNTPIALDIIFIGTDGRISNIEPGVPYSLESVRSAGLTNAVFEIRGGLSEELGIVPGDKVTYKLPE